jgi:hypothetical protein
MENSCSCEVNTTFKVHLIEIPNGGESEVKLNSNMPVYVPKPWQENL